MILCNGTPKAGTHLLKRALQLFKGQQTNVKHEHIKFKGYDSPFDKHVHIIRNPRNVMFSWMRFGGAKTLIKNVEAEIPLSIERIGDFVPWLKDADVLTVRFEQLLTDPSELQRISDHIGIPLSDNHFKDLWGRTSTFTGDLTNWKEHWTPAYDSLWRYNGGIELEEALGYDVNKTYVRRYADG